MPNKIMHRKGWHMVVLERNRQLEEARETAKNFLFAKRNLLLFTAGYAAVLAVFLIKFIF